MAQIDEYHTSLQAHSELKGLFFLKCALKDFSLHFLRSALQYRCTYNTHCHSCTAATMASPGGCVPARRYAPYLFIAAESDFLLGKIPRRTRQPGARKLQHHLLKPVLLRYHGCRTPREKINLALGDRAFGFLCLGAGYWKAGVHTPPSPR